MQRELKDVSFELSQKNETLGMKIETIKSLQDQVDAYRRSQNSDGDRLRLEISELQNKVIQKDEIIQNLHVRCDELVEAQIIEIPIYSGKAPAKKQKKKQNRNKSMKRGRLQFVREMAIAANEEDIEYMIDEEEIEE